MAMGATWAFALFSLLLTSGTVSAFKTHASALSKSRISSFEAFQAHFGRTFEKGSPEYAQRSALFQQQLEKVRLQIATPIACGMQRSTILQTAPRMSFHSF